MDLHRSDKRRVTTAAPLRPDISTKRSQAMKHLAESGYVVIREVDEWTTRSKCSDHGGGRQVWGRGRSGMRYIA